MCSRVESAFLSAYYEQLGERVWLGLQETVDDNGAVQYEWIDGTVFNYANWGQEQPGVYVEGIKG